MYCLDKYSGFTAGYIKRRRFYAALYTFATAYRAHAPLLRTSRIARAYTAALASHTFAYSAAAATRFTVAQARSTSTASRQTRLQATAGAAGKRRCAHTTNHDRLLQAAVRHDVPGRCVPTGCTLSGASMICRRRLLHTCCIQFSATRQPHNICL
jgi:hypothetical protein